MHDGPSKRGSGQRGIENSLGLAVFQPKPIVAGGITADAKYLVAAGQLIWRQSEIAGGGHSPNVGAGLQPSEQGFLRRRPLSRKPTHVRVRVTILVNTIPRRGRLTSGTEDVGSVIGEARMFETEAVAEFVGGDIDNLVLPHHALGTHPHGRGLELALR